mmetsp:Transcript_28217/g.49288  ORF Transcript_28217/g.49288 Transcript_28217/m.49288 type:complete len:139 (+) Transcript_28217:89-505(+)
MLKVKELEASLRRALSDGVTNVLLINDEGALIAAARSADEDQTVSAVLASIYNEYRVAERMVEPGANSVLQSMLFDCANARVACTSFVQGAEDSQILLCVCGNKQTHYGILWNKLDLVKGSLKCLEPIFAVMTGVSPG